MFAFLVLTLSTLYPKGTLAGFAKSMKTGQLQSGTGGH